MSDSHYLTHRLAALQFLVKFAASEECGDRYRHHDRDQLIDLAHENGYADVDLAAMHWALTNHCETYRNRRDMPALSGAALKKAARPGGTLRKALADCQATIAIAAASPNTAADQPAPPFPARRNPREPGPAGRLWSHEAEKARLNIDWRDPPDLRPE